MVSVMLFPCMLCIALLMDLFVLCVPCLTVFVNCLVKQFAISLGVFIIFLFNVIEVLSVGGVLCWIYRVWSSRECGCCACDPSVHLSVPAKGFVHIFVCQKLCPHLRVGELDHMCLLSLCCFFV